jgi:dolichyl-phosphate beta-glucosyltransferase
MPRLSIVVPMFREALRIGPTLDDLTFQLARREHRSEVVLVDDGSPDQTTSIVERFMHNEPRGPVDRVTLVRHPLNRGKGAAVRTGLAHARGHWRLMMDADNACRIDQVDALLRAAVPGVGMACGSRLAEGARVDARPHRRLSGWVFKRALGAMGLDLLRDTQCGFKLYRADVAAAVCAIGVEDRYAFDLEHLLIARQTGLAIREVGVAWQHQDGGQVNPVVDGVAMLRAAWGIRGRWRSQRDRVPRLPAHFGPEQPVPEVVVVAATAQTAGTSR